MCLTRSSVKLLFQTQSDLNRETIEIQCKLMGQPAGEIWFIHPLPTSELHSSFQELLVSNLTKSSCYSVIIHATKYTLMRVAPHLQKIAS